MPPRKPLNAPMTGAELDATLVKIFGENRQSAFARAIASTPRTVRSWIAETYGLVPTHIAILVRLMLQAKVTPEQLPEIER
ncbi:helix-turn-helix domain-containing protein [Bradyrhizobium sp. 1(2017)]|uniref:helix-turn-helix domain-containing protein n=1 Tax=Bradyrhizobium sp. 1(2017) TaxID=1404888 RepID=UPI00140E9A3B|nr:helix-turn-helix domain-containing protein [Bradyrhizobium sp. 1(2017)]QIO34341.1 helix-turn-helix domain-containing protein [Bradyrhizobium sp. 1(2017)]